MFLFITIRTLVQRFNGFNRLESRQDVQKYGEIILDFSYLKTSEIQEGKVEANEVIYVVNSETK